MAVEKKVKVKANSDQDGDTVILWGVIFVRDGKRLVAELGSKEAKEMADAGRVVII
jgi:hypothetical protein